MTSQLLFLRRFRKWLLLVHVRLVTVIVRSLIHPFIIHSPFVPRARGFLLDGAERIVVFRQDEWGDAILTSAFLRGLRTACPHARISLVVKPGMVDFYHGCPWADEVLGFAPARPTVFNRLLRHAQVFRFAVTTLVPRRFDAAITIRAEADLTMATLAAFFANIPLRAGWTERISKNRAGANRGFDLWLTHAFTPETAVANEVELTVSLLRLMGGADACRKLETWNLPEDRHAVENALRALSRQGQHAMIAFGIGSNQPKKQWPHYRELAGEILCHSHCDLLLVGGPEDGSVAGQIQAMAPDRIHNLAGKTTLRQTGLLMQSCRLYIGNDTGAMHAAAAAGLPVVEFSCHPLDGEQNHAHSPLRYGPWGVPSLILRPAHAIPPCSAACTQPLAHCITQVTLEQALPEILDFMRRHLPAREWR